MRKRLRKKLHKREFREYGVDVNLQATEGIGSGGFDDCIDSFITSFVESRGLYCGGGWNPAARSCGLVVEAGRDRNLAESLKGEIRIWLEMHLPVEFQYEARTIDLWYDQPVDCG